MTTQSSPIAAAPQVPGKFNEAVVKLASLNSRLNELCLTQRDSLTRITGENPMTPVEGVDQPRAEGVVHDLMEQVSILDAYLQQLSALTDTLSTL